MHFQRLPPAIDRMQCTRVGMEEMTAAGIRIAKNGSRTTALGLWRRQKARNQMFCLMHQRHVPVSNRVSQSWNQLRRKGSWWRLESNTASLNTCNHPPFGWKCSRRHQSKCLWSTSWDDPNTFWSQTRHKPSDEPNIWGASHHLGIYQICPNFIEFRSNDPWLFSKTIR